MTDPTPYRRLPWSETDLLLHPTRFLSQREAHDEIARLRSLLDEREYPRDGALLARTATALDRKATEIVWWSRPGNIALSSVATGLLSGGIGTLVRGPLTRASVAAAVVCLAFALGVGMAAYLWPLMWSDVAEEYRKLAIELRRLSDRVAASSGGADRTGVRVDPTPGATEDSDSTPARRAREKGER